MGAARLSLRSLLGILLASLAFWAGTVSAGEYALLDAVNAENLPFEEVRISEKLLVYFHQRMLGEALVEKDFIVYQFDPRNGELLARKSSWRADLPDSLPAIRVSAAEAGALIGGEIESATLLIVSPDSDVFPMSPTPANPCWMVRSVSQGRVHLDLVDAVTGKPLGEGVPPPAAGFSLTGPIYFNPCDAAWYAWAESAEYWFEVLGYPTDRIVWPTEEQVAAYVQSDEHPLFYELAHGGSSGFTSGCVDGQTGEETSAGEIELWLMNSYKKLFAFIGSCDGLCNTGNGSLSYEFRKGSTEYTATVGYCGMSTEACATCWIYSLSWQDQLFHYVSLGYRFKDAFDQANADYPTCAINECMRFAGDESFALISTSGACCIGASCQVMETDACTAAGGVYFPEIDACDPDPCAAYVCCAGSTCQIVNLYDCLRAGGTLFEDVAGCDPNPCSWGACCLPDSCGRTIQTICDDAGGEFHAGITCDPEPCIAYACCLGDSCALLLFEECASAGGEFVEGWETCDPNPCVARPCCLNEACQLWTLPACSNTGGVWLPDLTECDAYVCLPDSLKPEGGVLIVHAPPGLAYTAGEDWCARYGSEFRIIQSSEQVTRLDPTLEETGAIWYVLAAFSEPVSWCAVTFGFGAYDAGIHLFMEWGACHGGGMEAASAEWPGPNEGTALIHAQRWSGNYEPVYWFAGLAYGEGQLPLCAYSYAGQSGVRNCRGQWFPIECFGALGVRTDGSACHPGQTQACCVAEECLLLTQTDCLAAGGEWHSQTLCDPSPCGPSRLDPDAEDGAPASQAISRVLAVPNPFVAGDRVVFAVGDGAPARVCLAIHDLSGRRVRRLVDQALPAGVHACIWDGRDEEGTALGAGMYFCRLEAGGRARTERMILIR